MPRFDFRDLVERLPLVVYVDELDEQSSPLYISPQIARLLGYSRRSGSPIPSSSSTRIHPDDRERVLADIATERRDRHPRRPSPTTA